MTTIHFENSSDSLPEIIYTDGYSRPSKSLLTPELYNKFKLIKNTNILPNLTNEDLIKECTNYIYDNHTCLKDCILINETCINSYKIIIHHTFAKTIEEMNNSKNSYHAVIFTDIYTYPKIQFMYILSNFFLQTILSMSQFYNFGILFCENKNKKKFLQLNKAKNIKDFNVKISEEILKKIKNYNDNIFKRTVCINDKIDNLCNSVCNVKLLNNEIEVINKYYKMYISKCIDTDCNNCKMFYSNLLECLICENCYTLVS